MLCALGSADQCCNLSLLSKLETVCWSGPLPRSLGGEWPCPPLPLKCAKYFNGVQNNPSGLTNTAFKPFNCSLGYIATEMSNDTNGSWEGTEGCSILHLVQKDKV